LIYTWSVLPAGVATISDISSGTPTIVFEETTPSGVYTIAVEVGNPYCNAITETFEVYVNRAPEVSLAGIQLISDDCDSLTLTPMATYNLSENFISEFNWGFPGAEPATSAEANPATIVYSSPGEYTVTIMVGNECGEASASTSFRLLEGPGLNFALADSVCVGEPFMVENSSTGDDLIYTWSVLPAGVATISDISSGTPTIVFEETTPSGVYTIAVEVGNPYCNAITETFEVYVNRAPAVSLAGISDECETLTLTPSVMYNLSENFIGTFNWSFQGADTSSSADAYPVNIVYSSPGEYMVTIMVGNECGEASASESFRLLEGPGLNFAVADSVCVGEPVTVENSSTGDDLIYTWSVLPAGVATISDISSGTPTIVFEETTPSGVYTIAVEVGNPYCNAITETFELYVNRAPEVSLAGISDDCDSLTLTPMATYNLSENFISEFNWSFQEADPSTSAEANPSEYCLFEPRGIHGDDHGGQ
jgi:PKD repeat protein